MACVTDHQHFLINRAPRPRFFHVYPRSCFTGLNLINKITSIFNLSARGDLQRCCEDPSRYSGEGNLHKWISQEPKGRKEQICTKCWIFSLQKVEYSLPKAISFLKKNVNCIIKTKVVYVKEWTLFLSHSYIKQKKNVFQSYIFKEKSYLFSIENIQKIIKLQ